MKILAIILISALLPLFSRADVDHKAFRKIAVFPIAEANFATTEDAWWQMREMLTKDKRFLIAAKRFMINRGVFQPRKALRPADVIILGRLLDAEVLVVTYLDDRTLNMKAYEAENGFLLWENSTTFHPAVPINDQLIKVSSKMISDFVDAIPYQGFTEMDEVAEKVFIEKEGKKFVKVFAGGKSELQKGDPVQWVQVKGDPSQALFAGAKVHVIGEGTVAEVDGQHVLVQVNEVKDLEDIQEDVLVRFPNEVAKLRDLYAKDPVSEKWNSSYVHEELKPINEFQKDNSPATTGVAFFFNIVIFALLAF